jgi:hypothetical protein
MMRYAQDYHVVPVIGATTVTAASTTSAWVDMSKNLWVDFHCIFGAITGDTMLITVEECTANATATDSAAEVAIPFCYRKTNAAGSDTFGALTTNDSGGLCVSADEDGMTFIISVDPASLDDGYRYVRVVIAESDSTSAAVKAVNAILYPRYAQATPPSST